MEPQPRNRSRGYVRLVFSFVLFALALALFLNRQAILDQAIFWQFKPSDEVAALAERASLSERGRFYFYASQPELQNREAFNHSCDTLRGSETVVLGCYAAHRIYVFNVTDPKLDGIKEVTAAHEMLHAAYERLNESDRKRVDALINAAAANVVDDNLKKLLQEYDKTEPGERSNELHSILGTQVRNIGPELEDYYKQYFVDRSAVVALSEKYEEVFNNLRAEQDQLASELERMAAELSTESRSFNDAITQLNKDIGVFNDRAESGAFSSQAQFNAERAELVARQEQLRTQQSAIAAKIALYDEKRKQLEAVNSQAEALNSSINSKLSPVPAL